MEESGSFRTSMRGFHKQDVLNYIDALQAAHVQETEALRQQAETAEKQLSAAVEDKAALQKKTEELEAGLETCRQQAERVPATSAAAGGARQAARRGQPHIAEHSAKKCAAGAAGEGS